MIPWLPVSGGKEKANRNKGKNRTQHLRIKEGAVVHTPLNRSNMEKAAVKIPYKLFKAGDNRSR